MWMQFGTAEKGPYNLMQLAQSGIAPSNNMFREVRTGPAQNDSNLILVNLLI